MSPVVYATAGTVMAAKTEFLAHLWQAALQLLDGLSALSVPSTAVGNVPRQQQ